MKFYVIANKGKRQWFTKKHEAHKQRVELKRNKINVEVDEVEVPTDKDGLCEFLNSNCDVDVLGGDSEEEAADEEPDPRPRDKSVSSGGSLARYLIAREALKDISKNGGCETEGCACCADEALHAETHCSVGIARKALAEIELED